MTLMAVTIVGMIVVVCLMVAIACQIRNRRPSDEGTVTFDVVAGKVNISGNYSTAETFVRGEIEEATFCDNIHDNFYEPGDS